MSKVQTRRTVSLSSAVHAAATKAAADAGITCSEWVTRLIREQIPSLPPGVHTRRDGADGHSRTIRSATAARPVHKMTQAEVLAILSPQPTPPVDPVADALSRNPHLAPIPAGATCANCGDRPATHREDTAPYYTSCDVCDEPATEEHGVERGFEPNGGLLTAAEVREAGKRMVGEENWERDTYDILQMQRGTSYRPTLDEREMAAYQAESRRHIEVRRNTWAPNGRRGKR